MNERITFTSSDECEITANYSTQVLGNISTITYVLDEDSKAVQGTLVFNSLEIHPNEAIINIQLKDQDEEKVIIQLIDCAFSDRIELDKVAQFSASSHVISEVIK